MQSIKYKYAITIMIAIKILQSIAIAINCVPPLDTTFVGGAFFKAGFFGRGFFPDRFFEAKLEGGGGS